MAVLFDPKQETNDFGTSDSVFSAEIRAITSFRVISWYEITLSLKPGLHIVARIVEHACDDASKRILKLPTNRLQIFLVRDQCL